MLRGLPQGELRFISTMTDCIESLAECNRVACSRQLTPAEAAWGRRRDLRQDCHERYGLRPGPSTVGFAAYAGPIHTPVRVCLGPTSTRVFGTPVRRIGFVTLSAHAARSGALIPAGRFTAYTCVRGPASQVLGRASIARPPGRFWVAGGCVPRRDFLYRGGAVGRLSVFVMRAAEDQKRFER